jgi:hypothetical protein
MVVCEFATHPAVHTGAEDCGDLVAGEPPQTQFATRSNSLWMGKFHLKMKLRQYSIWTGADCDAWAVLRRR